MPVAIPLVAGAAATAGAGALGLFGATAAIGAGSLFGTFAGAAISGIVSGAASLALAQGSKADIPAQLAQPGAGRATMVRQPITPHSIPYGRIKTSGPLVFMHSQEDDFGRTYGNLYVCVALAGCKVRAIRTVYFGDRLATDELFEHPGRQIRLGLHLGADDQLADQDFVTEIGGTTWGNNHRLRGIAYIAARLTYDSTDLSHLEDISAVIDGVDTIYDPRTETTGFHNNAALCIANWLTSPWGRNLAWSRLDEDALIEAANICDERVLVRHDTGTFTTESDEGSPAVNELRVAGRSLDWGDGVRVSSSGSLPSGLSAGTTYYVICRDEERIALASTVANAFAGTAISITTAGSGTHTITYWDEARYKLNGSFTLDTETGEVLDQMRAAMAGYVFPRGGKWFIHAGAATTPTVTLGIDDLAGDFSVTPKRSMRDRINGVRAVYVNPDASWQPDDAPVLAPTATLLEEDAEEELYGDLRLNFVTSGRQMQRLMKIERERNRRQMIAEAPFKLTAMKLAPVDGVWITVDRYFTSKQFRVDGWRFNPDCTVGLTLQEDDADVYDWDFSVDEQEEVERPGVTLPGAGAEAPDDLLVDPTPETYETVFWPLTWTASGSTGVTGYEVYYTAEPGGTYYSWGTVSGTTTVVNVEETTNGHDFKIRAIGSSGTSDYVENTAPGAPTSVNCPGDGELQWTNDAEAVGVQIFLSGTYVLTVDVSGSPDVHAATGLAPGSYSIRSVNSGGNVSSIAGPVTVT